MSGFTPETKEEVDIQNPGGGKRAAHVSGVAS